jgi:hypothetical protein
MDGTQRTEARAMNVVPLTKPGKRFFLACRCSKVTVHPKAGTAVHRCRVCRRSSTVTVAHSAIQAAWIVTVTPVELPSASAAPGMQAGTGTPIPVPADHH